MKRYCGRDFSAEELQAIARLIEQTPKPNRAMLSRQVCQMLAWTKPDGGLKDMTCRVAMLRMQADGLITLPASQFKRPRRRADFPPTPATDPLTPVVCPVHELGPLTLRQVAGTPNSRLWNEYIARYHYLGYTQMSGAQMRYFVLEGERLLALLSFGASAWKLAARDRYIGWSREQREQNLQLVINNARFLILPWVKVRNLASTVLGRIARQIGADWTEQYKVEPFLMETLVDAEHFEGTCYRAAGWTALGVTTGRGRMDREHRKEGLAAKRVFVMPLVEGAPEKLRTAAPPPVWNPVDSGTGTEDVCGRSKAGR